jgi:hypothetical protein
VLESFVRQFRNETEGCLFDVVNGDFHDAPHRPAAAQAKAWSVAEVLRCLMEESAASPRARAASAPGTASAA